MIGIEVTEILSETRKRIEGGWQDVLDFAQNIWLASDKPQVEVRITFNDSIHISRSEKPTLANELIELIDHYVPVPGGSYSSTEDLTQMPRGIIEFSIYRDIGIENSHWRCTDADWPPALTSKQIQTVIFKKEIQRKAYLEKCEKIWLLLVLYGRRPSGSFIIPDNIDKVKYHFDFDKVYLFNAFPARTCELDKMITSLHHNMDYPPAGS